MISKSLSTSQKFAELRIRSKALGEFSQLLYPLIVAHADDFGRLQGDPFTVKHQCHPTSTRTVEEFEKALGLLHEVGLIQWFAVSHGGGGRRHYIQIVNFDAHQQGLHKRIRSHFPECPGNSGLREEKGREENLREQNKSVSSEVNSEPEAGSPPLGSFETRRKTSQSDESPTLLTFPTVGTGIKTWGLTDGLAAEWSSAFPGIDILAEAKKALAWLHANPGRQKTPRGMPRFLVSWLSRAQNSRRGNEPAQDTRREVSRLTPFEQARRAGLK